jgi:hypothetical protein
MGLSLGSGFCGAQPLAYFTDLLQKLANGWRIPRVDELLPHRWQLATDPSTPLDRAFSAGTPA